MRPFQFTPLKNPGSDIRLLEVLPGAGTGAVCCRLFVTALEDARGKYEPLSYYWGDQTRRSNIVLNDTFTHSIGADLNAALLRLRHRHTARVLWVDALCINQADIQEKSAQVPLMIRIYQYGRRTLVWLGEHDSKTAPAFSIVEFIAAQVREHPPKEDIWTVDWIDMYLRAKPKYIPSRIAQTPFVELIQNSRSLFQLQSVFGRPWFGRVWVIQEISTPSEALVICGAYQITWETIEMAHAACRDKDVWDEQGHVSALIGHRSEFQSSASNTLTDKILRASNSEATNPRDRIYAVLGLVSSGNEDQWDSHGITIDYGVDANELFKEITAHCLRISGSPDILIGSSGCCGYEVPGLPSWALYPYRPDSPYPRHHIIEPSDEEGPSRKAGGPPGCRPLFDASHTFVGISGLVFDKIASVGSARAGFRGSRRSVTGFAKWLRSITMNTLCYFEWKALADSQNEQVCRGSSESILEAFGETLLSGPENSAGDITAAENSELFRRFDQFMGREFSFLADRAQKRVRTRDKLHVLRKYAEFMPQFGFIESDDLEACSEFEAMTGWCQGKRLVVTERGYMGVVSRARKGDHVVLLAGAQTPFILRPDGPRSTMVSPCYIHAIMNGEAWDESVCDIMWIK